VKLILALLLLATPVLADKYIVICVRPTISPAGKQEIGRRIKAVGVDTSEINPANMPTWIYKANTNITIRVLCVRVDDLGIRGWKNLTIAGAEEKLEKNLSASDKAKVALMSRAALKADFNPPIFVEPVE